METTLSKHASGAAPAARHGARRTGLHAVTEPPTLRSYPWTRQDTVSTMIIGVLALVTRFLYLTEPVDKGTPVFDEKHYVPQAWDMVKDWDNLFIGGIETNPGYGLVVHPPLAKQIMAFSEMVFGYTPLGWRFMAALFGIATVIMIMRLARVLTGSWQVATFAGLLAVFDGVLLVTSKFGMLDIFQVFFIVAAAWALARDHEDMRARLDTAFRTGTMGTSNFGPRLGFRWWRFSAGVFIGLALSVKWSGLYYILFFGLLSVFSDLALRRRYGVRRYVLGTLIRDTVPALASLAALPLALYTWSWRAWFASDTSVYRHAQVDGTIATDSLLHKLPESLAGWLYYHKTVLEFHASLTSSSGHHHPWDSKPWAWLVAARPILYYSNGNQTCLGDQSCTRMLFLFGTPIIWWLVIPVLLWSLWALIVRRDRRFLIPVIGFGASFLPWLATFDRQMYFFYAATFIPFIIVALSMTLGQLVGRGAPVRSRFLTALAGPGTTWGTVGVAIYLCAVIAFFLLFSAILYGYTIPNWWYDSLMWLPSWQ